MFTAGRAFPLSLVSAGTSEFWRYRADEWVYPSGPLREGVKAAGGGCLQRGKGGKSGRDGERQKAAALGKERKIGRGDMFKRLRGRWIRGGVE